MKKRRHHNNKGYRQIKEGKTNRQLYSIAKKLGLHDVYKGYKKGENEKTK